MNKLSKFVFVGTANDSCVLYNTVNLAIVTFPKNVINNNIAEKITDEEYSMLNEMGFFSNNDNEKIQDLLNARKSFPDTLIVTISMTQACNFNCCYCSQNNSKDSPVITRDVLDATVKYIVNCVNKYNYKTLAVDFFGGEPLLAADNILYFKDRIESAISDIKISYAIDTNGYLLTHDFVKHFQQLYINLTLSDQSDHDTKRVLHNGEGTYDVITKNLQDISTWLNGEERAVRLRYNVGKDRSMFKEFVPKIKQILPTLQYIEIAPIIDFSYNNHKENLTHAEFNDWYINEAIDILVENNIIIDFPNPIYSKCRAYAPHDIKIFPDGKLATCSYYEYSERKSSIFDICENVDKVAEVFSIKQADCLDSECLKCKYVFLCGGKLFCKEDTPCHFLNYDLERFLSKYASYLDDEQKAGLFATL